MYYLSSTVAVLLIAAVAFLTGCDNGITQPEEPVVSEMSMLNQGGGVDKSEDRTRKPISIEIPKPPNGCPAGFDVGTKKGTCIKIIPPRDSKKDN